MSQLKGARAVVSSALHDLVDAGGSGMDVAEAIEELIDLKLSSLQKNVADHEQAIGKLAPVPGGVPWPALDSLDQDERGYVEAAYETLTAAKDRIVRGARTITEDDFDRGVEAAGNSINGPDDPQERQFRAFCEAVGITVAEEPAS